MKKIATLISSGAESVSVKDTGKKLCCEMSPKTATLDRIRQYARVAFSDSAIAGMPMIILN